MKHGISVAMIVENEDKHIKICIDSVKDLADEIIVLLDKNSNDGTRGILEQYDKVKIYENVYNGDFDFSESRNKSLKKCQYSWTFIIDGDEGLASDNKKIRDIILNSDLDRAFMIRVNQVIGETTLGGLNQCRCFPTRKSGEYKGNVHNQFTFDPSVLQRDNSLNCEIIHYGFADIDKSKKRKERTEKLVVAILDKINANKGTIEDYYNVLKMLQVIGKDEEAVRYGREGLNLFATLSNKEQQDKNRFLVTYVMASMAVGQWETCDTILNRHIIIAGETVDNQFLLFAYYYRCGKMISAFFSGIKYLELMDVEINDPVNMQSMLIYKNVIEEKLNWLRYYMAEKLEM